VKGVEFFKLQRKDVVWLGKKMVFLILAFNIMALSPCVHLALNSLRFV
jgi:hypothetical protein